MFVEGVGNMKNIFKTTCVTIGVLTCSYMSPAWADAQEDANFIASKLASDDVIAVQLEAIRGILTPTLQVQLEQSGIRLSPSSLRIFTDLFVEEFSVVFINEFRKITEQTYIEHLSASELADFRAFLESDSGKVYAEKQADILTSLTKAGELVGMKAGVEAAPRIQKRLDSNEDLGFSKSELEALRGLN